jgi:hypothetical protein
MITAFLSHPVAGDVRGNLARGRAWFAFLQRRYPDRAFVAPWIDWIEIAGDDDSVPTVRARGLSRCQAIVRVCEELWLVGERLSAGMSVELEVFRERGLSDRVRADYLGQREPQEGEIEQHARTRDEIVRACLEGAQVLHPGAGPEGHRAMAEVLAMRAAERIRRMSR